MYDKTASEKLAQDPKQFPNFVDNQGSLKPTATFLNFLISRPPTFELLRPQETEEVGYQIENIFDYKREEFDKWVELRTQGKSHTLQFWQEQLKRLEEYSGWGDHINLYSVLAYIAKSEIKLLDNKSINTDFTVEEIPEEMPSGTVLKPSDLGTSVELRSILNDRQNLQDRHQSLNLLHQVFDGTNTIVIPKVEKITSDSIVVEKAKGTNLINICTPEQIIEISEIPINVRKQFLVELFEGINVLNEQGYYFGDYNTAGFFIDIKGRNIWIVDPGFGEQSRGDYSPDLLRKANISARELELEAIFGLGSDFIDQMFDLLSLPCRMNDLKSLRDQEKIKSTKDVAKFIQQSHL